MPASKKPRLAASPPAWPLDPLDPLVALASTAKIEIAVRLERDPVDATHWLP